MIDREAEARQLNVQKTECAFSFYFHPAIIVIRRSLHGQKTWPYTPNTIAEIQTLVKAQPSHPLGLRAELCRPCK